VTLPSAAVCSRPSLRSAVSPCVLSVWLAGLRFAGEPELELDDLGFGLGCGVTAMNRSHAALTAAVEVGALKLDPATRRVSGNDRELRLGATEFRLLHFLMTHPERVHSRAQLLDRVWGDHVFIEERTVDVHVKRLREALSPAQCAHMIETVRGAGYRLTQQAQVLSA